MTKSGTPRSSSGSSSDMPESLAQRAALMADLMNHQGWKILSQAIKPRIKTTIMDMDDREAFLYESIRLQAIQDVLTLPARVVAAYRRQFPEID
jgi:hypothetical protein